MTLKECERTMPVTPGRLWSCLAAGGGYGCDLSASVCVSVRALVVRVENNQGCEVVVVVVQGWVYVCVCMCERGALENRKLKALL